MDSKQSDENQPQPPGCAWRLGLLALSLVTIVILWILGNVVVAVAFGSHHHGSSESSALGSLKAITTAQTLARESNRLNYLNLLQLGQSRLVDRLLMDGENRGYYFDTQPSIRYPEFVWWATANPVIPMNTGDRYFFTNNSGIIYSSREGPIEADPESGEPISDCTPIGK